MIFWLLLVALWLFSITGAIYFRGQRGFDRWSRYRQFIYTCAVMFAALPVASGDWQWSLLLLPLGLGAAEISARFTQRKLVARYADERVPKGDSQTSAG